MPPHQTSALAGRDAEFSPYQLFRRKETIAGDDWSAVIIHPEFGNHISFWVGRRLFSRNQRYGWASRLVSPRMGI